MLLSHSIKVGIGPGAGDDVRIERPDCFRNGDPMGVDQQRGADIVGFPSCRRGGFFTRSSGNESQI